MAVATSVSSAKVAKETSWLFPPSIPMVRTSPVRVDPSMFWSSELPGTARSKSLPVALGVTVTDPFVDVMFCISFVSLLSPSAVSDAAIAVATSVSSAKVAKETSWLFPPSIPMVRTSPVRIDPAIFCSSVSTNPLPASSSIAACVVIAAKPEVVLS